MCVCYSAALNHGRAENQLGICNYLRKSFTFTCGFQFWGHTDKVNINRGICGSFNAITEETEV